LASETLPIALERSLTLFQQRRLAAFQGEDFKEVQRRLYAMKAEAIEQLPRLIEQFTRSAEAAGAAVHRAATAAEARQILGDIARRHNVRLAVKSKSMATEEVGVNEFLVGRGVNV